ncbi:MAG: non-hydrolyzing UDP-N-acetylglucosamine 2-epimerase [Planctomycetota bacterium JB042]
MSESPRDLVLIVGARPNFMKAGPVLEAVRSRGSLAPVLVHTGQHYDERMSDLFFRDLGLPRPDVNLEVGSASHARQTADVMVRFEEYLEGRSAPPSGVLVVGDVNSTVACALVAAKRGVPLVHVEAGLRSFDRGMPEELNRIVTDQLADVCYVTEPSGVENLRREGKDVRSCPLVGNTMIDTLVRHRERAEAGAAARREEIGVERGGYAVVTLHRPSNVDDEATLAGVLEALEEVGGELPLVWPLHPRTEARARAFGLEERLRALPNLKLVPPQGYLDFLGLTAGARLLLTDSGGIQEEAVVLKVPCVTLRENTERPVTIEVGGNLLAGSDPGRIVAAAQEMLARDPAAIGTPEGWDGRAAERIADDLEARLLDGVTLGGGTA